MGWKEDFAAIASREADATPWPWRRVVHTDYSGDKYSAVATDKWEASMGDSDAVVCSDQSYYPTPVTVENQDFIAAARTDLPALRRFAEKLIVGYRETYASSVNISSEKLMHFDNEIDRLWLEAKEKR